MGSLSLPVSCILCGGASEESNILKNIEKNIEKSEEHCTIAIVQADRRHYMYVPTCM
jgi:hypothetical protein